MNRTFAPALLLLAALRSGLYRLLGAATAPARRHLQGFVETRAPLRAPLASARHSAATIIAPPPPLPWRPAERISGRRATSSRLRGGRRWRRYTEGSRGLQLTPPGKLGPYRIVGPLGAGGSGVVYEAIDPDRSLRVALKTLPSPDPANLYGLKNEFRNVANLHHPNLVHLYELMESDGVWFFTMELLSGKEVTAFLASTGPAPRPATWFDLVREAFRQLAQAVDQLHRHGLLHLDLKPANVLVEPDGRVVLLDFGISRRWSGEAALSVNPLVGTPGYMAPEQMLGRAVGFGSDWYAFGLMLYEVVAGELPWTDPWAAAERGEPAARARARRDDVPSDLEALCSRLLAPEPGARPDGEEIIAALGGVAPPRAPRPQRLVGREPQLAALQAAADEAIQGGAVFVHVTGLSGMGKSSLAHEFLRRLRSDGRMLVLSGRCHEWESLPYKGLDSIVDGLTQHLGALPARERERLSPEWMQGAAQLFPVLRTLVRSSGRSAPSPSRNLAEERARAFRAFKQLLHCVAERQPIACFVDDVHWGDSDSARLLVEVLSPPSPPRLLLVAAYRSDEARQSPFLRELGQALGVQGPAFVERRVDVEPLGDAEGARLACELLEETGAAERGREVAREAGGNPFFIEQLVRHRGEGRLESDPPVLDDVVRHRVQGLAEEARRILQVVAVAGHLPEQDLAMLAAGVTGDPHRLLSELRAASLVKTRGPRRDDPVEPYHDRIRESVVRALSPLALRSLHRSIAETLEQRGSVEPQVLSMHYEGAGDLERALGHAVAAADQAFAALAFDRASALYARAVGLGGGAGPDALRLMERHGESLFNAGRGAEAAPAYLEAANHASGLLRRELHRKAVEALLTAGRIREGVAALVPLAKEAGVPFHSADWRALSSVAAQLMALRFGGLKPRARSRPPPPEAAFNADLCWTIGRGLMAIYPPQGVDFLLRGLVRALRLGEPRRLVRALTMQGTALVSMGGPLRRIGEECLARADQLAAETGDPYLKGIILVFRGFSELAGAGRWSEVIAQTGQGMGLLREHCTGVSWELDMAMGLRLKAAEPGGEIRLLGEEALEWAREVSDRGDLYSQNVAAFFVALHRLALGDPETARLQVRRPLAAWDGAGYTVQHYHATRLEVHCDLYCGRPRDAWSRFGREQPKMKRIQLYRLTVSRIEVRVLEAVIRLHLAANGVDRAEHLRGALALAARLDPEVRSDGKPHATMIRACAALLAGDGAAGTALLDAARRAYLEAGMHGWAWAAWRRLGEAGEDASQVADADAWFRGQGIAEPDRWAGQLLPPVGAQMSS